MSRGIAQRAAGKKAEEDRKVVDEVPLPEPPGLEEKAVKPLHAALLHPARGSAHTSGDHVEGATDAAADRDIQVLDMVLDPLLLKRCAECDEENVRPV